jgi:multidrug transporter EmrE-like cation transporter
MEKSILNAILFLSYAAGSVLGLILMRLGLPVLRVNFASKAFQLYPALLSASGICIYLLSFLVWLTILSRNELSKAFPIAIALTFCGTTIAGAVWLREQLTLVQMLGCGVILIGVVLVSR